MPGKEVPQAGTEGAGWGARIAGDTQAVTYSNYLQLDKLLSSQVPRTEGPEHDELLFIIIHQVYELWFKELIHEMDLVAASFEVNDKPRAMHTLNRIRTILKTLVSQVDILETMTPMSFASIRARLEAASGFQSAQFREIEFILGKRNESAIAAMPEGDQKERLAARLEKPALFDSFIKMLSRDGYDAPKDAVARDWRQPTAASPAVQALLLKVYREDPVLVEVCERLVDVDEGLQEWRYRHIKMVERTIGTKPGTGGSSGADYLKTTIFKPAFPDLWAIRNHL